MIGAEEFRKDYLCHAEGLYRIAFYMLESRQDAEDAVQDLYLKLWRGRETLDSVRNPRAWCITLLRNICLDRIRAASSHETGEEPDANLPSGLRTDSAIEDRERLARVMEAVRKLPRRERQVLEMRVYEELSYKEMEERSGMNRLTLRVLLSNARKKIRKSLI